MPVDKYNLMADPDATTTTTTTTPAAPDPASVEGAQPNATSNEEEESEASKAEPAEDDSPARTTEEALMRPRPHGTGFPIGSLHVSMKRKKI